MGVLVVILCALLSGVFARLSGVNISGSAGVRRSYEDQDYGLILDARFGDKVLITCSGTDARNLTIKLEESRKGVSSGRRIVEVSNTTTLKLSIEMPGIGGHDYSCTDVGTACCVARLRVEVWTVISVVSPNVRRKNVSHGEFHFVPIAEDYEVVCTGTPELRISKERYDIQTISINETAIKTMGYSGAEYTETFYECKHSLDHFRSVSFTNKVDLLIVDYPPAASNFWCVEYGEHINCSWGVLSKNTTFSLFYTEEDGNMTRIYEYRSAACSLNLRKYGSSENLTFVMQSCNFVYCANETYHVNRLSIQKIRSPYDLKVFQTSHGVVLKWKSADNKNILMEYKITYRIPGVEARKLNASFSLGHCLNCEFELRLPCSGAFYVVNVNAKLTTTPITNEAYWSDPARVTFRTDPQDGTVDPLCNIETTRIENKEIAVYKISEFAKSFQKDGSALRGKANDLKRKLDLIKEIRRGKSLV